MSLELTGCLVRFGERDGFDAVVAVVILPCESCIERGDDCGRHYAVLRVVGNPLDTGRDFDLSMEPADAERIGYEFIRVGRLRLAGPPTRVKACSFTAEQARIVQLLVERVDVEEDALEVRIRVEGLASLVGELRQQGERMAA